MLFIAPLMHTFRKVLGRACAHMRPSSLLLYAKQSARAHHIGAYYVYCTQTLAGWLWLSVVCTMYIGLARRG